MGKSPKDLQPGTKRERELDNSTDELSHLIQLLEAMVSQRKKAGDYNVDSADIRYLAEAVLLLAKRQQ